MPKRPKDIRSTGRRRGRAALEKTGRPYKCECELERHHWHEGKCGYTPKKQSRGDTLDVNHKNKNLMDNDPVNLEWLCRRCHKEIDSQTTKGEMSQEAESSLYGDLFEGY